MTTCLLLVTVLRQFIFVHISLMMHWSKQATVNILQRPLVITDLQSFPLRLNAAEITSPVTGFIVQSCG